MDSHVTKMTAADLDAVFDRALAATRFDPARPLRRRRDALGMAGPSLMFAGQTWQADHYDPDKGWVFTRAQVKRMKRALKPVLAGHEHALASVVLALRSYDAPQ